MYKKLLLFVAILVAVASALSAGGAKERNWDPGTVRETYIDISPGDPNVIVGEMHVCFLGRELHE